MENCTLQCSCDISIYTSLSPTTNCVKRTCTVASNVLLTLIPPPSKKKSNKTAKQDGLELDVPHGSSVPFIISRFDPPYTVPVARSNEIAVPVVWRDPNDQESVGDAAAADAQVWPTVEPPSDVETE